MRNLTKNQKAALEFLKGKNAGDRITSGEIAEAAGYKIEINPTTGNPSSSGASSAMQAFKRDGIIDFTSSRTGYVIVRAVGAPEDAKEELSLNELTVNTEENMVQKECQQEIQLQSEDKWEEETRMQEDEVVEMEKRTIASMPLSIPETFSLAKRSQLLDALYNFASGVCQEESNKVKMAEKEIIEDLTSRIKKIEEEFYANANAEFCYKADLDERLNKLEDSLKEIRKAVPARLEPKQYQLKQAASAAYFIVPGDFRIGAQNPLNGIWNAIHNIAGKHGIQIKDRDFSSVPEDIIDEILAAVKSMFIGYIEQYGTGRINELSPATKKYVATWINEAFAKRLESIKEEKDEVHDEENSAFLF